MPLLTSRMQSLPQTRLWTARRQRGASLLEFVLVFPLFLVIVGGSIQITLLYTHRSIVADALDVVANAKVRSLTDCGTQLSYATLTGEMTTVLAQAHANFLLPDGIFAGGNDLGLTGTVCEHPIKRDWRLDAWLRYTLPCPFCRIMTLGYAGGRISTALRYRGRLESVPPNNDPVCPVPRPDCS